MLDSGKLHPMSHPLIMTSGRPSTKIQLNLNDHEDFLGKIRNLCKFPSTKDKIKSLCTKLNEILQSPTHDESTQTEMQSPTHEKAIQTENVTEDSILEEVLNLSDNEMLYIFENIWINVPHSMKLNFTFEIIEVF